MKKHRILAVIMAVMLAACLLLVTSCDSCKKKIDLPTGTFGETAFGNKTHTDTVKDPSNDVTIKLIRGKNVLDSAKNALSYNGALNAGDIIEVESDYKYITVDLFDALGEQTVYSPSGQFTFQIPSSASQAIYPSGAFGGSSHTFTATVAAGSEITGERNLAVNPYDYQYVDEKNDQTVAAMDSALRASAAVAGKQVAAYPHAYANRVTRGEVGFYARNAIDGNAESGGHGNYPYQSWGYDQKDDAEFIVYFGRDVKLSSVGFTLRADYAVTSGKEHDTYWESATLEFSDGSELDVAFEKSGEKQSFPTDKTTSSVRIKNLKAKQNANSQMYAALTEFEAVGRDAAGGNEAAEKTTVTTTFGGKEQKSFSTSDYSYAQIKDIMDHSNDWFINKTESENYQIFDWSGTTKMTVKIDDAGWKDAVYYSGLTEAFLTTGDMDEYYFMRAVGNQFKYLNNDGSHTMHGDYFQIGESYLQLNDLRNAKFKYNDTLGNADWTLAHDYNDTNFTGYSSAKSSNKKDDWTHMGYWWCDALYMAMNSYTLLTLQTGERKYAEAAYEGYSYWKNVLYNDDYNLWCRDQGEIGTNTGHIDPETNELYPVFWARGNAWVLAALAKQLMYLDADEFPDIYAQYKADYLELAEAIAKYQRDDGTWNVSIVDGNYYGGKETTGTMGYIYAYCIGLRLGVLDSAVYYPIVKKAWTEVSENCIFHGTDEKGNNIEGQVGYMQTTGYQPKNYDSEEYSKYNTHEFGMGLFLLACSGMMSICSDYVAPSVVIPADPQAALLG